MKPRPSEQQVPQKQLFRVRLETFIDLKHPLVQLAKRIDWAWLEQQFSQGFGETGPSALPVRFVVGLIMLKQLENVSDEGFEQKWPENPYWQYFCGFEYFQHQFPADSSSLSKWRKRMGTEGAQKLLSETLRIAVEAKLVKTQVLTEVVVDTTVQQKNVAFPTDAKLLHTIREKLVQCAEREGLSLRQSYRRISKLLVFKYGRYLHARQFNRAQKMVKALRIRLGRVMRDVRRKWEQTGQEMSESLVQWLRLGMRIAEQTRSKSAKNKVYSVHEPQVACIAKGKARTPYEFGSKVSVVTTVKGSWVLGMKSFTGNPYDGSTLRAAIIDAESISGVGIKTIFADKGYRGTVHWPETARVILSGRKRLEPRLKRLLKRRQSIEPIIGHLKSEHRFGRNFLKGTLGDELNAILAGVAFNLRKLVRALRRLFVQILRGLLAILFTRDHQLLAA
jgi:transposase, IS5 family